MSHPQNFRRSDLVRIAMDPIGLLEQLRGTEGLIESAVHGRSVHLLAETAGERVFESIGARRIVPSLEDVFVHLVTKEREARAA